MIGIDFRQLLPLRHYCVEAHKDNLFFDYVKTKSTNFTIFFQLEPAGVNRCGNTVKIPTFRYLGIYEVEVILHRIIIQEAIVLNVKTSAAPVCENRSGAVIFDGRAPLRHIRARAWRRRAHASHAQPHCIININLAGLKPCYYNFLYLCVLKNYGNDDKKQRQSDDTGAGTAPTAVVSGLCHAA